MNDRSTQKHSCRKILGVIWLVIEVNLLGGTIFGFPALFKVLSDSGIYSSSCSAQLTSNSSNTATTENSCDEQTKQYQVGERDRSIHIASV